MYNHRITVALPALAALALSALALAPTAGAANGVDYYVSLGDSFAAGSQPPIVTDSDQTDQGYADQLSATLRAGDPKLRLVKLGCGGESTTSMVNGPSDAWPSCDPRVYRSRYPRGTQLAEAVSFLHAHRGHLRLVTIDIGGNDLIGGGGVPAIQQNLPVILTALRSAAGQGVPIVGMTYYDPFLPVVWYQSFDLAAVQAEAQALGAVNDVLRGAYRAAGDPVADVEGAFSSTDTTQQPDGLPLDVERICQWTWICTFGDLHPNATGYGVIAEAFRQALP
jgi:lysophospholipase L1-like esterase